MKLYSNIDFPKDNFVYKIGNPIEISGWAFFENSPASFIEIWIDDMLIDVRKFDQKRNDVINAYPFAGKFNGSLGFHCIIEIPENIQEGKHQLKINILNNKKTNITSKILKFDAENFSKENDFFKRFNDIPEHLLMKVNGSNDPKNFIKIGDEVVNIIEKYIDKSFLLKIKNVLDFGCGLGRVAAPLKKRFPHYKITGFDVDPFMTEWIKYLYKDLQIVTALFTKDLSDSSFDFIYAISVFTHLNTTTNYWLSEICRLLTEDGIAFLTYHDETLFNEQSGTSFLPDVKKGSKLNDLYIVDINSEEGSEFKGTYYTTEYWEKKLSQYYLIEKTIPRGLFGHQSLSIVKKKKNTINAKDAVDKYINSIEKELIKFKKKFIL